ncbi:MAG: ABC transporter permease [bacterium]|nr:ABC transporter permease [bacterium]
MARHDAPPRAQLGVGVAILAVIVLPGLGAPWLAPYDPVEQTDAVAGRHLPPLTVMAAVQLEHGRWRLADRVERTAEGLWVERLGRSELIPAEQILNLTADGVSDRRVFLLGTDGFSRDVFSRLIHGARISLFIGGTSIILALTIGVAVGALAALGGRFVDSLLMRIVDGLITFPWLILLIALAAIFPTGKWTLSLLLGGTAWMGISRLVRAEILSLKERDFIVAARGLGAGPLRIFFRHLLPNALTPILVYATLMIGGLILVEASLSFLGYGVQAPDPSWGNMIADGRNSMGVAWWIGIFPGLAIVVTVIALSLVADALRDVLDPRRYGSENGGGSGDPELRGATHAHE